MPKIEREFQVDDVDSDAAAAYAEVLERSAVETVAPRNPPPVESKAVETEPAAAPTDKGASNAIDRDKAGRFAASRAKPAEKEAAAEPASKDGAAEPDKAGAPKPDGQAPAAGQPAPAASGPPPSWGVKSKSLWDNLPAEVRADVLKREDEAKNGLQGLQEFKDLRPWADMAKQHGTTIGKSLERYVGMENMLRRDPGQGLALIAQNAGLDQRAAAQLFASLAQRFGGAPGAAPGAPGAPAAQPAADDPLMAMLKPLLQPVLERVQGLQTKLDARESADRNAGMQTLGQAIETFSVDPANRYFPQLEEHITKLFQTGMVPLTGKHESDLRTAYDLAARMHPEVHQALIEQRLESDRTAQRQKDQEAADKAKKASRSITGARVPGTVVKDRTEEPTDPNDIEADVRRAYQMVAQH